MPPCLPSMVHGVHCRDWQGWRGWGGVGADHAGLRRPQEAGQLCPWATGAGIRLVRPQGLLSCPSPGRQIGYNHRGFSGKSGLGPGLRGCSEDRSWTRRPTGARALTQVLCGSWSSAPLKAKERGPIAMRCEQTPTSGRQLNVDPMGPGPPREEGAG